MPVSRFMAGTGALFCPVVPDPGSGIGDLSYACAGAGAPGSACQPCPISRRIGGLHDQVPERLDRGHVAGPEQPVWLDEDGRHKRVFRGDAN